MIVQTVGVSDDLDHIREFSGATGALTSNTLIEAICSGFVGAAPKVCTECSACPDKVGCVINGS